MDAAELSVNVLHDSYKNRAITITGQQSIKVSDMLAIIFEIKEEVDIRYLEKSKKIHYGITPYRYTPKPSMKLTPVEFFDLGQGILNIIEEIHNNS